jgi:hypothetical protein
MCPTHERKPHAQDPHQEGRPPSASQGAIFARRMHELAMKNQEGTISQTELAESDSYVTVADLLGILKSKARQRLKRAEELAEKTPDL